jgi:sulfur-oxidizing protein SoxY
VSVIIPVPRRRWLQGVAAGMALHALRVRAAEPDELAKLTAAVQVAFGTTPIAPGRVTIDVPPLAENGLVVPVTVRVESPMTPEDHVTRIDLFAPRNNLAQVAQFHLGPRNGIAKVSTRIRMAVSQELLAVARLYDGSLWSGAARVEVVSSGCG